MSALTILGTMPRAIVGLVGKLLQSVSQMLSAASFVSESDNLTLLLVPAWLCRTVAYAESDDEDSKKENSDEFVFDSGGDDYLVLYDDQELACFF
jgi:hypothetical protein